MTSEVPARFQGFCRSFLLYLCTHVHVHVTKTSIAMAKNCRVDIEKFDSSYLMFVVTCTSASLEFGVDFEW